MSVIHSVCGRRSCDPPQVTALLNDYPNTLARAINFDNNLTLAAFAVTPQDTDYADILSLSARQVFGNIELTAGWDGTTYVPTDIMAFMRGMYEVRFHECFDRQLIVR